MRTRTLVAALAGLVVGFIAYRFLHVGIAAGFAAAGLSSLMRGILTARAFFYLVGAVSGLLALAASCATFLAICGKGKGGRWKRGLCWGFPVFLAGLAVLSGVFHIPASTLALLLGAAVSMFAASR